MYIYVLDRRDAVSLNTAFHLAPSSKSHNLEQPESSDQGWASFLSIFSLASNFVVKMFHVGQQFLSDHVVPIMA